MPQHYIKIEIKGDEKNLPKEPGLYVLQRLFEVKPSLYEWFEFSINDHEDVNYQKEYWLRTFDWYLLPVPDPQQPEQPESIREISKKIYQANYKDFFFTDPDEAFHKGIELGVDFASQSHNNTVVGPTEQEIKTFIDNEKQYYGSEAIACMEYTIKYILSQCKAIDLRATLIKFCEDIGYDYTDTDNLNEFLKSPENK